MLCSGLVSGLARTFLAQLAQTAQAAAARMGVDLGEDRQGDHRTVPTTQINTGRRGQPLEQRGIGKLRTRLFHHRERTAGGGNQVDPFRAVIEQCAQRCRIADMTAGDHGLGMGGQGPGRLGIDPFADVDIGRPGECRGTGFAYGDRVCQVAR